MAKQLANAREKIERAQQHIEDKRVASRQAIERLEKEYENMAIERRDNDKYNEELRAEADAIERKVSRDYFPKPTALLTRSRLSCTDGRSSQTQRSGARRITRRILGTSQSNM
jgi:hypothetical protein